MNFIKSIKFGTLQLIFGLCLIFILTVSESFVAIHPNQNKMATIVIDPGHGGKDPGCIGKNGKFEKTIALDVSLKLGKLISDSFSAINVIYTRKNDRFIELWERANIANKNNADLFISVHCNAHQLSTFTGSETYVMGLHKSNGNLEVSKRENSVILMEKDYEKNQEYMGFDPNSDEAHIIFSLYQNAFRNQSLQLAQNVQSVTTEKTGFHNRGVKEAGFLVLWKTAMPGILFETGFLTNPNDLEYLSSEKGRAELANALFKAFIEYKNTYEKQPKK